MTLRRSFWCIAAFLPALAFVCHDALANYFGPDDLMNLYLAWVTPVQNVLKDLVLFWQAQSRPVGTVFYRAIYELAGFRPEPFVAARVLLLALNLWLAWRVFWRLTGSPVAAWLATLLLGYQRFLFYIYASTGMVYDILCATGVLAGFLLYLEGRGAAWVAAAAVVAVGAKEQGTALAAVLLVHRLLVDRKGSWAPVLGACTVTAAFVAGRLLLPGPMTTIDWYKPEYTWARVSANAVAYTRLLADNRIPLSGMAALVLWIAFFAAAWRWARPALVGLVWFWAALTPLLLIPGRDGYVLYLPLFGMGMAASAVVARWSGRMRWWEAGLWGVVIILFQAGEYRSAREDRLAVPLADEIRRACTQTALLVPQPKPNARFLLINSPLEKAGEWSSLFALGLQYGRRDIQAQARTWDRAGPLRVAADAFDHVLLYDESRRDYQDVTASTRAGMPGERIPSRARMGEPAALVCIVSGLGNASPEGHRWGLENLEFRFAAPPGGAGRFFLSGFVPELTVRQNGPLRVKFYLDGKLLSEQKLAGNVLLRVVQEFPARLPEGAIARIRLEVLNPLRTESDTISISVREAGIE